MPIKNSSYKRLERAERGGPTLDWDLSSLSDDELLLLEEYFVKLSEPCSKATQGLGRAERVCERILKSWVWGSTRKA